MSKKFSFLTSICLTLFSLGCGSSSDFGNSSNLESNALIINIEGDFDYLKASNTNLTNLFGYSVAISGGTTVVGAFYESSDSTGVNGDQTNSGAQQSGAAYVFIRDTNGDWGQQAYLKASNTALADLFGSSVAISGDTIVIGAYRESSNATGVNGDQTNNSASSSGAAYVFIKDASSDWSQQAYLKASNTDESDQFGHSVTISGDNVVVSEVLLMNLVMQ